MIKTKHKIFIARILFNFLRLFLSTVKVRKIDNIFWIIDLSEGIDLNLFLLRKFEPEILDTAKILAIKSKNKNILDIGANIGVHTLQFAKNFKDKKIHSIEPTSYCFKKLKKNLSINPFLNKNVKTYKLFIKSKKTFIPKNVYSSWKLNTSNLNHPQHFGFKKSIGGSKSCGLDFFIKKNKINDICFIKLDVDGHELSILKSGHKILKKKVPIIMELAPYLYPEYNYNFNDLINLIKKYNYKFYSLNPIIKISDINNFTRSIKDGSSVNILIK